MPKKTKPKPAKSKTKPGPKPEVLKPKGNWEDAVKKGLTAKPSKKKLGKGH
ncbi:MAG: hypothetical protein NTU53_05795 [Planctomycetota bacterium]|nr:hypothetical protein [Planctomycetota bacterium]